MRRFHHWLISSSRDLKFRVELRAGIGPCHSVTNVCTQLERYWPASRNEAEELNHSLDNLQPNCDPQLESSELSIAFLLFYIYLFFVDPLFLSPRIRQSSLQAPRMRWYQPYGNGWIFLLSFGDCHNLSWAHMSLSMAKPLGLLSLRHVLLSWTTGNFPYNNVITIIARKAFNRCNHL